MLTIVLLAVIIALLVGIGTAMKKGANEIIRGLESIDQRLASLETSERNS